MGHFFRLLIKIDWSIVVPAGSGVKNFLGKSRIECDVAGHVGLRSCDEPPVVLPHFRPHRSRTCGEGLKVPGPDLILF